MNDDNLKVDLISYLKENYFFIKPEIYSYFNSDTILFFVHKKDLYYNVNKERIENFNHIEFLEEKISNENWRKYIESNHLKWFADEFRLIRRQYKSNNVKISLKEIFKTHEFVKTLNLPNEIKDILKGEQAYCANTKVINETERIFQNFVKNEKIYFNQSDSNYANPGIIINKNSDDDIKILYFTNIGKFELETNLKEINGWSFIRVNNKEIGKTPSQAKQNSYL
ncbi:hypothetical protein ASG22_02580 [Chryseobacterium sp. Leaf405]|uniref:hypothetical protein n=1 Tax=Chryseobacterium sp. Leaf405 TaxID=1736367 RepID=UPI0006FA9EED|nr:hypothetical protein [Chryseobacterium sp. Leaf405]KQT35925.1 hypothetical protein ASG22_02580 [Chryseobacterium sp. Leaf405]